MATAGVTVETKVCTNCKVLKGYDDFSRDPSHRDGRSTYCKSCRREKASQYRKTNKYKQSMTTWLRGAKYGVDREWYNKQFIEQKGRCAICGKHQSELKESLNIDHCHVTNKVRKLLCATCNVGLGCFHDNTDLMLKAVDYLNLFNVGYERDA